MTTNVPNFNSLALLVFEIKRVSNNLMSGLPAPAVPRTLKLLCVLKVLGKVKQPAKFQHRIYMHRALKSVHSFSKYSVHGTGWSGKGRGGKERGKEREDMDGRGGMHEENLVKSQK